MPNFQLGNSQKVSFVLTALDAKGQPAQLAAGDTIQVVSSNPAMASVALDASPVAGSLASGFVVGGNIDGTVTVTSSALKADGSLDITITDQIDIISGAAATLSFGLGTPVAQ